MAIFRNVNMSFWTDPKVVDDYTPEDRYFMLWALTNNYTNISGCYEVSKKQIASDLGYDPSSNIVDNLLKRFQETHKTIEYDFETKELLVKNWSKYNWSASPKLDVPLLAAIEKIKSDRFYDFMATLYNERKTVDEKIPYRYGIDTTITITNTIPIINSNTNTIKEEKKIDDDLFEELWSLYPRKQGKTSARKAYLKAIKNGVSNSEIQEGLENYLMYIKVNQVQTEYIKHGSTWFNQNCWQDSYSLNSTSNNKTIRNGGSEGEEYEQYYKQNS